MRIAVRRDIHWSALRTALFYVVGLGSYAWVSFGFFGVYTVELRYAFTTRLALLLFVVPWLVSLGKPVALAEAALSDTAVRRLHGFLNCRLMRFVGNAVFEPLFTLALFMIFVTPLSGALRLSAVVQDIATVLIPVIGLMMVLPIMENTRRHTAMFITFEFILSFAALIFDAIPGILLRLNDSVLDHLPSLTGNLPFWWPNALHDQHLSGDFLWFLAEVLDIPVIIILFVRWSRIDRSEAKVLDELTDEQMEVLTQAHLKQRRE